MLCGGNCNHTVLGSQRHDGVPLCIQYLYCTTTPGQALRASSLPMVGVLQGVLAELLRRIVQYKTAGALSSPRADGTQLDGSRMGSLVQSGSMQLPRSSSTSMRGSRSPRAADLEL